MTTFEPICSFVLATFLDPSSFIPLHDPRFLGNEKAFPLSPFSNCRRFAQKCDLQSAPALQLALLLQTVLALDSWLLTLDS